MTAELLLVLDADHVPQPDILDATVGYFDDPTMAVVQTPHDFGNHDSFQHFETGRHDQSMFFEVILPGKDRHNSVFWCGSAAVIRREALIEVGGVATETIAEDFHTTIKLHGRGWRTRYHGETLVQGLAPHDLSSYLLQRDRWARGNLAVFRTTENPLRARNLSLAQRVSYLSSLLAYFVPFQRLGLLIVLTVMLLSGQLPMHATLSGFLIFWLPWIAFDLAASTLLCRGRATLWDGTYSLLLTLGIFARAARVVIAPTPSTFKVTPKDGIDDGGWHALRQLHMVVGIGVVLLSAITLRALAVLGVAPSPQGQRLSEATEQIAESFEALNAYPVDAAVDEWRTACAATTRRSPRDWSAILPRSRGPGVSQRCCRRSRHEFSSLSLVRYRLNDYSVPTTYGHRDALVRRYVDDVVISCGAEVIARHPRSYERHDFIFDPLHYLALIEQKINALDQASPLAGWRLPEEFVTLRRFWKPGWSSRASASSCRFCD